MDNSLVLSQMIVAILKYVVLILVVMDNSLVLILRLMLLAKLVGVLILVVMDNSLVPQVRVNSENGARSLNPCCNGQ